MGFPTRTDHQGPTPAGSSDEPPPQRKHRSFFAELPVLIAIAFVLALLLKTFLLQAFYIPSASMEPTLLVGDRVLVNKVIYELREPRRGEIVVFAGPLEEAAPPPSGNAIGRLLESLASGLGMATSGEKDFIKRIIGLPGDQIEMRQGVVYVNGEALAEAPTDEGGYLSEVDLNDFGPTEVPAGQYFMMGDNRPNSSDSRFPSLGTIPRQNIIGRAFVIIWPVPRLERLPRAEYPGVPAAFAPLSTAAA
jgi:signal peptidase I